MKYFKNTELAKIYNVSEKSVRNWIQSAIEGKNDLQLHQENGKLFIANTAKNIQIAESLIVRGKKYKNSRGYKIVEPSPKFYKLYSQKQVIDIIAHLDIYREIPVQYTYFNSGAERWDLYTKNLLKQATPNSLTNTIQLLDLNIDYIDTLLEGYSAVNIVDIGVGNALPVREILDHFQKRGTLNRYVGIDISKELLGIAKHNIETWFGDKVQFEGYVRDINYERFDDLLVPELFGDEADSTINLVFFLGGTISNLRDPNHALSVIHDSVGKKDLVLFSKKLDTVRSRRYFEMAVQGNQELDLVMKLLNLDESMYTFEQFFDEKWMARQLVAKLNVAVAIKFQLFGQERVIELNKGETILLWRARHQNTIQTLEQFDQTGFELLHASRSKDQDYLLTVSQIKATLSQ